MNSAEMKSIGIVQSKFVECKKASITLAHPNQHLSCLGYGIITTDNLMQGASCHLEHVSKSDSAICSVERRHAGAHSEL